MKLSCICILVLIACTAKGDVLKPTYVIQKYHTRAYEVNTELDKVMDGLLNTLDSIAMDGIFVATKKFSPIIESEFALALLKKIDEIDKDSSTLEFRKSLLQAVDNAYNTFTKLNEGGTKLIQKIANKSFDSLPKDVQKKVLVSGREINDKLKTINVEMNKIFKESSEKKSSDNKN